MPSAQVASSHYSSSARRTSARRLQHPRRSQNARRRVLALRAVRPGPLAPLVHPGPRIRDADPARPREPLGLRRLVALVHHALRRRGVGIVLVVLPVGVVVRPLLGAAPEPVEPVARVGGRPPRHQRQRSRVGPRPRRVGLRPRRVATPRQTRPRPPPHRRARTRAAPRARPAPRTRRGRSRRAQRPALRHPRRHRRAAAAARGCIRRFFGGRLGAPPARPALASAAAAPSPRPRHRPAPPSRPARPRPRPARGAARPPPPARPGPGPPPPLRDGPQGRRRGFVLRDLLAERARGALSVREAVGDWRRGGRPRGRGARRLAQEPPNLGVACTARRQQPHAVVNGFCDGHRCRCDRRLGWRQVEACMCCQPLLLLFFCFFLLFFLLPPLLFILRRRRSVGGHCFAKHCCSQSTKPRGK